MYLHPDFAQASGDSFKGFPVQLIICKYSNLEIPHNNP